MPKNPRLIDLTGSRFGRLFVIRKTGNNAGGGALWECECDCGGKTNSVGTDLRLGRSLSCGCIAREKTAARCTSHGGAAGPRKSRLYTTWQNMKRRCADTSNPDYGAKGIRVSPDWTEDFAAFSSWAIRSGYDDTLTIERIDITEGYSPHNCTWIPRGHQAYNRSIVATAPDGRLWRHIARANGITNSAYATRVSDGWSYEDAATRPMYTRLERQRDASGRYT